MGGVVAALDKRSGEIRWKSPRAFQGQRNSRREVACGYRVDPEGVVGFEVGAYDPGQALVIDPVLQMSSRLGGRGRENVRDITTDAAGNPTNVVRYQIK